MNTNCTTLTQQQNIDSLNIVRLPNTGIRIREDRRNQRPYGLQPHSLVPRKVDAAVRSVVGPQLHLVLRVRGVVGLHEGLSLPAAIMRKVEGSGPSAKAKNLQNDKSETPGGGVRVRAYAQSE